MAIFRGVGGSGSSSDNSFLQEVTAQATTATTKANEASASATSAEASATSAANSLATIQNTEVTSASFNTGDGVLTLTKLGGATVTADLDGRFLTSYTETNDLSSAVTWVNVPNAYVTAGSVTQHQAALTITESQISDLQSYLTSYTETNNLTTAVTWANVPDANITESSVTQYLTAANVTSPLTGGTGISVASNGTITNDSPDQTVALTGTGATTVTGTYPNFTIDSTNTTYTIGDGGLTTNDFTDADHTKLNGIEANATADQTGAEIKSAYEAVSDTNAFTDAEKTKLSGIETSADVTDTVNVTAAGALMDSEVTNLAQVKAFDSSDYLTTHQDISGKANLSGATFTGNVNIGTPPSGTQSLTVAGNIIANGTVDGVDIAARDAVLTSTTTTANSAMQDLVDDTSPQLGGDLDLNGNDITGTGNISITQSSTSTPALKISSTDTSDVASPTIRLERRSPTTADDDEAGKIEFYGWNEAFTFIPPIQYANITGVLKDVTHASYDGQLDFNLMKDGTSSLTTVMSLTSTTLELPNGTDLDVAGDITVGGTVDGRDVATDGTKLDTIPYHRVNEVGLRSRYSNTLVLTTSYQDVGMFQDVIHPSTPVDCSRYLDLRLYIDWRYVSSATNDLDLQIQFTVPSATTANLGSATVLSPDPANHDVGSYQKWGYVSGDHTHHFTEFGKINKTGTAGGTPMRVYSWYYNEANDRTYFLHDSNPGISLVNGDTVYWHPYDWESAGNTMIKDIEIDTRYLSFAHQTETHKVKIAYDDSRLTYRFKLKERSTSDSAVMDIASVTFTDVGEI